MSTNLIILPIFIPFVAAILCMFLHKKNWIARRVIALTAAVALLISCAYIFSQVIDGDILVFTASGWQAPFGIVLAVDMFSGMMITLSSITSFACLIFAFATIDRDRENNYFYPLWFFIIMGINGSFVTGDMFNLYVFFEIMLMASYGLSVIGSTKGQLRESFKYVMLNIVSSTIFVMALAMLYGMMGTLNMADLSQKIAAVPPENQGLITVCAMIFLVVFGMKGAIFPLYLWLPRTYIEPPSAIAALFGGLLTKVGVYAMIRMFTLIFIQDISYTHTIILWLAAFTMPLGVFGAVAQMNFKQILSIHIISQIGYMIMGLGLFTVWSIAGAIFYICHNIIVKTGLFLLEGATFQLTGTSELKKMSGLLSRFPWLGWSFLIAGLALAGVPPLSGFFGKFVLMKGAVMEENYWILAVAIITGFFTLFSMMKIFIYSFWGEEKGILPEATAKKNSYLVYMPACFLLVGISILLGICAEPVIQVFYNAAEQIMEPQNYIDAVMSVEGVRVEHSH